MNLLTYLREVRAELVHVNWPTRAEVYHLTVIVLGASLFVGLYIGGLDYTFTSLLGIFLK
ncbi:TPA: preprotein translocase subunit SecE [Candidatus Collierbacteria bacterium]|uniref:Protein translocase subunit SecE n=2 Tax=Candidatus Collieribacteriota TaxID=1752725 RepID=A0A1F5FZI5_9BACT|nr:MAG: Preprotein translocase, SecE subunit, bacterial [Microgenomates group bacterium GW2011_GWF1_46_12]KKU28099.1 MAG: Preprotein translocase, SecE subunit, bacterial [Microgenomates group bacterium GW2011_GWF2_46_18]KKU45764.1 MAG: Preprotein translocase, SecE subunit, bacterial [Microgenomates group bacterium GW2011_GWB1_46_7]KKU60509.1 MAG: Preprotein translocase, SecE subunit, bacterial [Microgenomates group bacterium GW2011_GWE1_47_12]KKU62864.1 MAG: Preprotein translocase, SecE subunit